MLMESLSSAIAERTATVGVIGLGYVGLPLSVAFTRAGFSVRGFDIDKKKVNELEEGHSYVEDVSDGTLQTTLERGFVPSTDLTGLEKCEIIIFAVPTEFTEGSPDMSALAAAAETAGFERDGQGDTLYVVASTVYPGAVDDVIRPALTRGGPGQSGTRIAVVPERLSPGSGHEIREIPVVVGANNKSTRDAAAELFSTVAAGVTTVDSTKAAAAAKLLENTYRLVNISLVNEFALFARQEGIDVWETIEAAATKPFGFAPFYPGVGAGGHCTPVDPQFLAWRSSQHDVRLDTIETATEINREMPGIVVSALEETLAERECDLSDTQVHAVGLTYKPGVADVRNSPAMDICERLAARSVPVHAVDPLVSRGTHPIPDVLQFDRTITANDVESEDILIYLVDHPSIGVSDVVDKVSFTFDVTNSLDVPDAQQIHTFAGCDGVSTQEEVRYNVPNHASTPRHSDDT
jgi:nucleotide sugar dehydrogenase